MPSYRADVTIDIDASDEGEAARAIYNVLSLAFETLWDPIELVSVDRVVER